MSGQRTRKRRGIPPKFGKHLGYIEDKKANITWAVAITDTAAILAKDWAVVQAKVWAVGSIPGKANYPVKYIPKLGRFARSIHAKNLAEYHGEELAAQVAALIDEAWHNYGPVIEGVKFLDPGANISEFETEGESRTPYAYPGQASGIDDLLS